MLERVGPALCIKGVRGDMTYCTYSKCWRDFAVLTMCKGGGPAVLVAGI